MTKAMYIDVCESMGSEPLESEMPVELDDFPIEVQEAIEIYYKLKDDWDTMNGNYMGKDFSSLKDILDIYKVDLEDRRYLLEWFSTMDAVRQKIIKAQKPKKSD